MERCWCWTPRENCQWRACSTICWNWWAFFLYTCWLLLVSVLPIYSLVGIGECSSHILFGWNCWAFFPYTCWLLLVSVLPIYSLVGIGERSSHILVGWNWWAFFPYARWLELVSVLPICSLAGIGERSSHMLVGWNSCAIYLYKNTLYTTMALPVHPLTTCIICYILPCLDNLRAPWDVSSLLRGTPVSVWSWYNIKLTVLNLCAGFDSWALWIRTLHASCRVSINFLLIIGIKVQFLHPCHPPRVSGNLHVASTIDFEVQYICRMFCLYLRFLQPCFTIGKFAYTAKFDCAPSQS